MIVNGLHKQMVALDGERHRDLRIHQPQMDWSVAAGVNAIFVAGAEFADACREYPILFVRAGNDDAGRPQVAPIAALGLAQHENLYLDGTRWRARYLPALLRAYPFAVVRDGPERALLSIDMAWAGLSSSEGTALFDADGQPGEHLRTLRQQLEQLEREVQRTQQLGRMLLDKDLLRDMRFDADLPDGHKLRVDGFLTVDEARLAKLGDADTLQLHRSGVLGLIHAHFVSMGNMRQLVQWRIERPSAANAAQAAAAAPS